jgi:hypothetical protein
VGASTGQTQRHTGAARAHGLAGTPAGGQLTSQQQCKLLLIEPENFRLATYVCVCGWTYLRDGRTCMYSTAGWALLCPAVCVDIKALLLTKMPALVPVACCMLYAVLSMCRVRPRLPASSCQWMRQSRTHAARRQTQQPWVAAGAWAGAACGADGAGA